MKTRKCKNCGRPFEMDPMKTPANKVFCGANCRDEWWNNYRKNVKDDPRYITRCKYCNKEFSCYGNRRRKYCSFACSNLDRFW